MTSSEDEFQVYSPKKNLKDCNILRLNGVKNIVGYIKMRIILWKLDVEIAEFHFLSHILDSVL